MPRKNGMTGLDLAENPFQNRRITTMRKRAAIALVWKTVIVIATVVVLSDAPAHTATPFSSF
jgi:hypothetical protein